jgi:predicted dehydrogenase
MLNCAVIGFGGLGKVHFGNLSKMENEGTVKIAALCDVEESQFTKKTDTNLGSDNTETDLSKYNLYTDYKKMLAKEKLDFIVSAVPTYLHAEVACAAFSAGVNVFSEKPMAISLADADKMLGASEKSGKMLMIGQCLRYWPEYVKLKEYIDSGVYGKIVRADFSRLSSTPLWSWQNWYMDEAKSGGAALDLHVHDVDTVNWLFGPPSAVFGAATHNVSKFDSISTNYIYDDKTVTAVGDWGFQKDFGFFMKFLARFEKADVEMGADGFKVYTADGILTPEIKLGDAYYSEVSDFINCLNENRKSAVNLPESSLATLEIALLEKESALRGEIIYV